MSDEPNPGGPAKPALPCTWPWSHEWTHWELAAREVQTGDVVVVPRQRYQRRRCLRCGKTEQQHVGPMP
jgi:hypothetical protein